MPITNHDVGLEDYVMFATVTVANRQSVMVVPVDIFTNKRDRLRLFKHIHVQRRIRRFTNDKVKANCTANLLKAVNLQLSLTDGHVEDIIHNRDNLHVKRRRARSHHLGLTPGVSPRHRQCNVQ